MALLSKEQILTNDDLKTEDVPVAEWGGTVRIRTLTAEERDEFEGSFADEKTGKSDYSNFRSKLVARSIVDENGKRLFSDRDVSKLGMKSASALNRIFERAWRLSGITDQSAQELAEDFGDTQSASSSSG